jgi:hypothetical protein
MGSTKLNMYLSIQQVEVLAINIHVGREIIPYPHLNRVKSIGYSGFRYPLPSLVSADVPSVAHRGCHSTVLNFTVSQRVVLFSNISQRVVLLGEVGGGGGRMGAREEEKSRLARRETWAGDAVTIAWANPGQETPGRETQSCLSHGQPRAGDAVTTRPRPTPGGRCSHDSPEANLGRETQSQLI